MIEERTFDEIQLGEKRSFSKTISETDMYLFAGITGDFNPLHINENYAKKTIFKERIAHGILTAGLISATIGTKLPESGSIYLSQTLKFKAPVKIGDIITAEIEVVEKIEEKSNVRLKTMCKNQEGRVVIDGEAIVKVARRR